MENHRASTVGIVCCGCIVVLFGLCEAAQNEELFSVDVGKQKAAIGKEFDRIDEVLSQAKLQEARSAIDVIEHKIDRLRKNLAKEENDTYRLRIDKDRKSIPSKEDSLVNVAMEILHSQGVEASLQYTQNDMRQHGVSDPKIAAVEKRILEEAPAIKQAQERDQIARALKIFESGQLPDSSVDPYIVRTAQLILKAREDSVKRIEDGKKRKELEEQERIDRVKMEKEMKEKKIEEEHLAKERKEEEKKKAVEEAAQRKRMEADEKEKQRQAKIDEERQKKLHAQQKDSIALAEKISARKAELERASRLRIAEARERMLQSKEGQNAPPSAAKDSGAAAGTPPEQPSPDQGKATAAQAEDERAKLAQQEKTARDSVEREQKARQTAQAAQAEDERAKLAQQEKTARDSVEGERKTRQAPQAAQATVNKQAQQPQQSAAIPSTSGSVQQPVAQAQKNVSAAATAPKQAAATEQQKTEAPLVLDKSVQAYLQSLKDNQKDAQKKVMEIYDLIEQKQGKSALDKFKQNRAFIGQYVETQVFNILEQAVMQSVVVDQSVASPGAADSASINGGNAKKVSPEQQSYTRINNYLRDNNVEAAYAEFKRSEKQLKAAMTKSEFKQLKNMVETAYKIRHPGK